MQDKNENVQLGDELLEDVNGGFTPIAVGRGVSIALGDNEKPAEVRDVTSVNVTG